MPVLHHKPHKMGTSTGCQQPTTILDLGASVQHPVSAHLLTACLLCEDDLSLGHRNSCDVLTHTIPSGCTLATAPCSSATGTWNATTANSEVRIWAACPQILALLDAADLCRLGATCRLLQRRCMSDAALW
jgi:hypothetical protein